VGLIRWLPAGVLHSLFRWNDEAGGRNLEADLRKTADWADENELRWAFTLANAGSFRFDARYDLAKSAKAGVSGTIIGIGIITAGRICHD